MRREVGELLAVCASHGSVRDDAHGGRADLSCPDVMAALGAARVPDAARDLVRAKYLLDAGAFRRVKDVLCHRGQSYGWGEQYAADATGDALYRIFAADGCTSCNGEGRKMVGSAVQVCPDCHGSGMPDPIPRSEHGDRVLVLYRVLRGWEESALDEIGHQLHVSDGACVSVNRVV